MSTQAAGFALSCLRYGYIVNPDSAGWRVGGASITMSSAMSSSICGKAGVFQNKSAFTRSSTVYVTVQNIGGNFPPHRES